MKKLYSLLICSIFWMNSFGYNYPFEQVQIAGVDNPLYMTISPDGLTMIVVDQPKKQPLQIKICGRPYIESPWSVATPVPTLNKLLKPDTRVEGFSFSYDNKRLYFAANIDGSLGGMDIFYCTPEGDDWSVPVNLGTPINSELDENYPSVSGNNRTLFFTRELKMKKLDQFKTGELFKSEKDDKTNEWLEPEKVNNQINVGGIAFSKVYDDNKTIIYSQVVDDKEGWKIWWTKRLNDIHWFLPVRLDTLASKDSEISPLFCKQDKFLYFIKLDDGGFSPKGEMYRYKLDQPLQPDKTISIKGKVINPISNQPVNATILVTDPKIGKVKYSVSANEDGYYTLLNDRQDYMFHVWNDGYSNQYKLFTMQETNKDLLFDFKIFPTVNLTLNMYDREELWPLDGTIQICNSDGKAVLFDAKTEFPGQKRIELSIGKTYTITVTAKDYQKNELVLDLSAIVLFPDLVRDIELVPDKRNITIQVVDAMNKNPLVSSIEVIDKNQRIFRPDEVTGTVGNYSITLREGEPFDVEVRGPRGFAFKHTAFDLDTDRALKTLVVELQPLTRKVPIRLNNINFEYNSADLLETSYPELDRVVQLLKENPDIHIEIMAHTDDIGSESFNNILANKRAQSAVDYLIIRGIVAERLEAKGYGESVPLVPNTSEENRAINRRVEMKILDENDADYMIEERISE